MSGDARKNLSLFWEATDHAITEKLDDAARQTVLRPRFDSDGKEERFL